MKKPSSFDANLIVIGAGAAGLVSAYIAAAVKAKVILIEKEKMGGDCLNTGCVPSKALIKAAKVAHLARNSGKYGVNINNVDIDFDRVMARVHEAVGEVEPHDSVERYSKLGVECIAGAANIISPHEVQVGDRVYSSRHIIVASGARPAVPPIKGLSNIAYLTSENLWQIKSLPKRLLVVGGGPIGCELAQAFCRLGSKVTLVDMADKLLPRGDADVSRLLEQQFKEEGIVLKLNRQLQEFQPNVALALVDGEQERLEFDAVLVAVGRRANIEGFGLEAVEEKIGKHPLEIVLNKDGTVKVDRTMRTSIPSIFACGDVAGPYQFTHTASHQAWYASVNALFSSLSFIKKFYVGYRVIPWVIFTDPEIAHVGTEEGELIKSAIAYETSRFELDDLDRAIVEGEKKGFVKVFTAKGKDKILGATIVSSHAGELLTEFVSAMKYGRGLNSILSTIHSYPTWSEANKYTAGEWKRAHAPQWVLRILKKYHRFLRREK